MLELANVNVIFNKNTNIENHVLKNINLKICNGEFVTMIGGNGAGKTTIMNVLSGDVIANKGSILIDTKEVTKLTTAQRAGIVARVFQDPMLGTFKDLTIEENMSLAESRGKTRDLSLSITNQSREKFKHALTILKMGLENRLNAKVSSLSGGQRQALSLIMATLQNAKILLLDEHTAALDPKIGKLIMDITDRIIKQYKLTTLMVTHSMNQALQYGSRTVMMYHGKIARDIVGVDRRALSPDDLVKYFD